MQKYQRAPENIKAHYELEKQLANRLRNSSRHDRKILYTQLYDELFSQIPDHPQIVERAFKQKRLMQVAFQIRDLKPFLKKDITFLEIGAGDCALSREVAQYVKHVYALDVSNEIVRGVTLPANCDLILSDGFEIPVQAGSVNLAYSYQLMEHLHPEDAREQLENIYRSLVPGGSYFCITPNRLNGPHDISRNFDSIATGFHLKEYTNAELYDIFREAGFSRTYVLIRLKELRIFIRPFLIKGLEKILLRFPVSYRKQVASRLPFSLLLGIKFIGIK